jgi:hypothetical protein
MIDYRGDRSYVIISMQARHELEALNPYLVK